MRVLQCRYCIIWIRLDKNVLQKRPDVEKGKRVGCLKICKCISER